MAHPRSPVFLARLAGLVALILLGSTARDGRAAEPRYPERWIYCSANLQVDQSAAEVITLIDRAQKDGYTAMLLADYKLQVLHRVTDNYFRNAEKVKAAAARAGIELVPAVFSIGYSNGHLSHDPNLAEGLPVVDQPFVVRLQDDRRTEQRRRGTAGRGRLATPGGCRRHPILGPLAQRRSRASARRPVHGFQLPG